VFFWVVAVIMVSVAVVVGSILLWGTAEKRPPG
jgi:signal transduction histidine kinase